MPTVKFSPFGNSQTVNAAGAPASGWKIYTYQAGSSTPLATYTDSTGNTAQSNPVVINSLGFPANGQIWLQAGLSYKMVLTDQNDVVQKTEDNITGVNDTASSVSEWVTGPTPTYISATSFSVAGDQRQTFQVGRRMRFSVNSGTVYGTVATSVYNGSSLTTITIGGGEGPLDSGLSSVSYGFLAPQNPSIPSVPITAYAVRGLVGTNNAGAPTTKFDLSAEAVVLFNAATGGSIVKQNTGTITIDVGTFGPNGRDQAGAFSASTWLHLYFIWNGSTPIAGIASVVPPPNGGPTLSAITGNYTGWTYAGAVFFNGSSQLALVRFRGAWAHYLGRQSVLSGGSATTETNITLSSVVPPNAGRIEFSHRSQYADTAVTVCGVDFRLVSATTFKEFPITAAVSGTGLYSSCEFMAPNIGQNIIYIWAPATGTVRSATLYVNGYSMPNGGE